MKIPPVFPEAARLSFGSLGRKYLRSTRIKMWTIALALLMASFANAQTVPVLYTNARDWTVQISSEKFGYIEQRGVAPILPAQRFLHFGRFGTARVTWRTMLVGAGFVAFILAAIALAFARRSRPSNAASREVK